MTENTSYQFKLKILTLEIFDLTIAASAASSKVIAAGTVFAVGLILVLGAYGDKLVSIIKYLTS